MCPVHTVMHLMITSTLTMGRKEPNLDVKFVHAHSLFLSGCARENQNIIAPTATTPSMNGDDVQLSPSTNAVTTIARIENGNCKHLLHQKN